MQRLEILQCIKLIVQNMKKFNNYFNNYYKILQVFAFINRLEKKGIVFKPGTKINRFTGTDGFKKRYNRCC